MKKWIALLCAVSMMAAFTACGNEENSSSEPATEATTEVTTEAVTEATTEAETEATTEAVTEATTTEETVASEATSETEEASSEINSGDAEGADILTQEETVGAITLKVSPDWTKSESMGYPMWYTEDMTGAFFVQQFDTAEMGIEGIDHKEALETVGAAMGGMATVIGDEWDTVNGEDAYGISYSMDVDDVTTTNISIFFYVEDVIFGVTFSDFGGSGDILNYVTAITDSITF